MNIELLSLIEHLIADYLFRGQEKLILHLVFINIFVGSLKQRSSCFHQLEDNNLRCLFAAGGVMLH